MACERPNNFESTLPRRFDRRNDGRDFLIANFPALARMRIQPAHRHAGARQREFVAGLRREIDGQFHLMSRQCFGHARDGNMRRGQGDAQPAPAIIVAEEHHRRAPGFRERREQFGLSDEILFAGADAR